MIRATKPRNVIPRMMYPSISAMVHFFFIASTFVMARSLPCSAQGRFQQPSLAPKTNSRPPMSRHSSPITTITLITENSTFFIFILYSCWCGCLFHRAFGEDLCHEAEEKQPHCTDRQNNCHYVYLSIV
jgi:hypothetical protein